MRERPAQTVRAVRLILPKCAAFLTVMARIWHDGCARNSGGTSTLAKAGSRRGLAD